MPVPSSTKISAKCTLCRAPYQNAAAPRNIVRNYALTGCHEYLAAEGMIIKEAQEQILKELEEVALPFGFSVSVISGSQTVEFRGTFIKVIEFAAKVLSRESIDSLQSYRISPAGIISIAAFERVVAEAVTYAGLTDQLSGFNVNNSAQKLVWVIEHRDKIRVRMWKIGLLFPVVLNLI